MNISLPNWRLRQAATVLLLTTLAVRALIPLGYMPGSVADGDFVQLCPVASAATFQMLRPEASHAHHHGETGSDTASVGVACPIGSSLFFDAIPSLDDTRSVVRQQHDLPLRPQITSHVSAINRPYRARAPPHS